MDSLNTDPQERQGRIATLLLENRGSGTDWGAIAQLDGKPCPQKIANSFLLCCLLDYQMISDVAWRNGYRLTTEILTDPKNIWSSITTYSESEWKSKWKEYHLHRFPAGHN